MTSIRTPRPFAAGAAASIAIAVALTTACSDDTSEETTSPPHGGSGMLEQTPEPSTEIPEIDMGGTITVSQEMYGPTQGVTGTANVTVSGFAPLTPAQVEEYPLTLDGTGYTAYVEIENTGGEFSYNPLYFSVQTPEGDIYDADTVGLDDDLGTGDIRTGDRRRGSLLFEVPPEANLTELVLVATDANTELAVWRIP